MFQSLTPYPFAIYHEICTFLKSSLIMLVPSINFSLIKIGIRRILFAPFRGFAETDRNRALTALFIQLDVCWPSAPGHLASACQPCKNSESQSKRLALLYRSLSTSIVGFFNNLIFCVRCEILCSDNIVCMVTMQKLASDSN